MQENVPDDVNGASRPEGHEPAHGEKRVRQDWRARHLKKSGQPPAAAHEASHLETHDDDTPTQRWARQVLSWGKELLTIVVIAVVLSFLIKTFLFRAFYIPSGSMENTLEIQDRIFVNLLVPEPMSLKRGDVVVFKDSQGWLPATEAAGSSNWLGDAATFIGLAPDSSEQHLVKRVIGLPGDHVSCCSADGKLTVNGVAITEPYLFPGATPSDTTFDVVVPAGHLWVMGDHRNNSMDSRAHNDLNGTGFVPIDDVEGRAVVIAWPLARWGYLGNFPDVFDAVPEPSSASVGSEQHTAVGQ
ncbi:signal peptidase I [Arthrobacter psychrolactophilus]|uniref:Signal peptidase I n=1 Tax=Arthrobacter psychrolactophilus TaxID=92442 RepID=A0A2V5IV65_9MICC|nr:signal peptidase I [Arthrobacter psychrolactophilus]PYI37994.1 signal peptidase I [Arthrobacter psychrolactophilus]